MDKLKGYTKSSQDFFAGLIHGRRDSASRNPIEILKRLQREAFSDLMKLRDRQDKIERTLSFYKPSKAGPFKESATHVRGQVDLLGALLMMDNISQQNLDVISRAGISTGVDSRLIFETNIRQKDTLVAEFSTSQKGKEHHSDGLGSPLSLSKLCYMAKVSDWLSVMAIPIGAQCKDVGVTSSSFHQQGKGLTDVSSGGPPLLNLHNGSAIGIMVRKSNIVASLAQLVSGLGKQLGSNTWEKCSSTFGELACQFPGGMKVSLLGLYQVPLPSSEVKLGSLTFPILSSKPRQVSETAYEVFPLLETRKQFSTGSVALMVESEVDDTTKIGGWVEMNKLNPRSVHWGISMADVSEDSFGWGMSLNGMIGDLASDDLFQVESYLKFNVAHKFCLKPGLVYVADGQTKLAGIMLRSSWSF
ncbi:Clusterin alpha chain like [Senna tora]|uniref:Clusterin alpha chain like n=1 Tax=Senna tora TaxID=362788 RepID=A0A834WSG5_9FABA|nr:Clusterin alpha chain like [Senna tora]